MKCEVCLQLLEEYIDGELKESEAAPVSAHLVTCVACASEFESLTAEQEIYSRYDRDLTISPALWNEIAARTVNTAAAVKTETKTRSWREWFAVPSLGWSFAGAMAILIAAIALAVIYFQAPKQKLEQARQGREVKTPPPTVPEIKPENKPETPKPADQLAVSKPHKSGHRPSTSLAAAPVDKTATTDQSDVLFSEVAYSPEEERETQVHIENAQNLLRSVRNIEISEDADIDVTYEKTLSRRLLSENVILRREAEMSGKFPTKTLLSDLEPFLIDIANLPDKPAPDDLRVLKQRVQKTEIVAALQSGY